MNNLKVEVFVLSNYADISRDGKLSINGIFDEIFAHQLPGQFLRGFLVFTISGAESNSQIPVNIEITDATGREILKKEATVAVGTKGKGNFIAELVGLPLPVSGEYEVSLVSKQKTIGKITFFVTGGTNNDQKKGSQAN
jgi:hypothetical protein